MKLFQELENTLISNQGKRATIAEKKQLWDAKEAFLGSIGLEELPGLWEAGVDVICVRGAACEKGSGPGRFGEVKTTLVKELVATIP